MLAANRHLVNRIGRAKVDSRPTGHGSGNPTCTVVVIAIFEVRDRMLIREAGNERRSGSLGTRQQSQIPPAVCIRQWNGFWERRRGVAGTGILGLSTLPLQIPPHWELIAVNATDRAVPEFKSITVSKLRLKSGNLSEAIFVP